MSVSRALVVSATVTTPTDAGERYVPENRLILAPTDAGGRPTPAWGGSQAMRAQGLAAAHLDGRRSRVRISPPRWQYPL